MKDIGKKIFLAACLVATAFSQGRAAEPEDFRAAEDRRVFADALFSREMYKQASVEYARLIKDFPGSPELDRSYFRLGEALRLTGNKLDAANIFLRTAKLGGEYRLRAMFKRAALFMEMDQKESAVELFAELLNEKLTPDIHEYSLYYYGESMADVGRHAAAAVELEKLLSTYPKSGMAAYAKLSLGRIYAMPGEVNNLERSRKYLNEASVNPPTPRVGAEALFLLARAEFTAGNYKEAAIYFSELEKKYPGDMRLAESRLQAAWAYSNAGLYDAAAKSCEAALDSDAVKDMTPSVRSEYMYIRAGAEFQLLRYEEAIVWYKKVRETDPDGPLASAAQYQAALSAFRLAKHDKAMEVLSPILADAEFRERALWLMAEAAVGKKDASIAIQYYKLLVTEYPDGPYAPDALYRLGHQLVLADVPSEASVYFLQLAEKFPDSALAPKALFASATSLEKADRGETALRDWEEYIKRYPKDEGMPEALFRKASVEMRLDRKTEALATLDSLLQKFPKTPRVPDAHFWRAQLLREKNSLKDAEAALRASLAANPSDDIRREARFSLAMVLLQGGREAEAAVIFQELVDDPIRAKFTPQQFAWLSDYQFRKKDYENSAKTASLLVEQTEDKTWEQAGLTLSGKALRAAGKNDEAEAAFRKALEIETPSQSLAQATLWLAEILLEKGKAKEAETYFRIAVARSADPELQSYRIYAYAGIGHSALAEGRKEDAVKYLMTVSLLYKDDLLLPPIMAETIALLDEMGLKEEAARIRSELSKIYPNSQEAKDIAASAGKEGGS